MYVSFMVPKDANEKKVCVVARGTMGEHAGTVEVEFPEFRSRSRIEAMFDCLLRWGCGELAVARLTYKGIRRDPVYLRLRRGTSVTIKANC